MTKLRIGQVYSWQEMMDWASEYNIYWMRPPGVPAETHAHEGLDLCTAFDCNKDKTAAAFLCVYSNQYQTKWQCTYVVPDLRLPPLQYYSAVYWREEDEMCAVCILKAEDYWQAVEMALEDVKKWEGYVLWGNAVTFLDKAKIESGEVVYVGGG